MKRYVAMLLAIVLLTGCAKASENEPAAAHKISITSAKEDANNALDKDYSQFIISNGFDMEIPGSIFECSFTQAENYEQNYEDVFARYFDSETLSAVSPEYFEGPDGMKGYKFDDADKKIYACVGNNGFVCFAKPSAYDMMFGGGERVKVYHADRKEQLSDSYILNGEKITVEEAAQFAQKWLDKTYSPLEPDYAIRVKTIIARRSEMGIYSFDIFAEKIYNGVALDSLVQMSDSSYTSLEQSGQKMKYITQNIYMQMFTPDEIGSLTNGNGMLLPTQGDALKEAVSLSSALEYLEEQFADFSEPIEVSDIGLKYTLTPQNDYQSGQSCYDAGIAFESHIVWEFVIDIPEANLPVGTHLDYSTLGDLRKFIYVDVQSGEMDFEFDINKLMQ
ncbi:MAG: hypothetical protein IJ571_01660 [Ruminococcus sp.]|nr:hypothetical protein [Ruminococcus sp.]